MLAMCSIDGCHAGGRKGRRPFFRCECVLVIYFSLALASLNIRSLEFFSLPGEPMGGITIVGSHPLVGEADIERFLGWV